MTEKYSVKEFSEFPTLYKKVWKKYKRSFNDDYEQAKKAIIKWIPVYKKDLRKLPKTDIISGLGSEIRLPIAKTHIFIGEAKAQTGRLIYLIDTDNQRIFLIDVYYHPQRDNHDTKRIWSAYQEYCEKFPSSEKH